METIYAVGRADLPPGLRVAQVGHALVKLGRRGALADSTLVVCEARDEPHLHLISEIWMSGMVELWNEPDLNYELTAVTFFVVGHVPHLLTTLPLMFAEESEKENSK